PRLTAAAQTPSTGSTLAWGAPPSTGAAPSTNAPSGAILSTVTSAGHSAASSDAGSAATRRATSCSGAGTGSLRVVERRRCVMGGPAVDQHGGGDGPVDELDPGEHHHGLEGGRPCRRRHVADDPAVEEHRRPLGRGRGVGREAHQAAI